MYLGKDIGDVQFLLLMIKRNVFPIPKKDLPIPENIDLNFKGNPLDNAEKWKKFKIDGKKLVRETDTLDTL